MSKSGFCSWTSLRASARRAGRLKSQGSPSGVVVVRSRDHPGRKPRFSAWGTTRGGEYTSHILPSEFAVYAGPTCMDIISVRPLIPSSRSSVDTSAVRLRFGPAASGSGTPTLPVLVLLLAPPSASSLYTVASCAAARFRLAWGVVIFTALFDGASESVIPDPPSTESAIPNPKSTAELGSAELLGAIEGTRLSGADCAEFAKPAAGWVETTTPSDGTGREDSVTPPLRFAGAWAKSSIYWATRSWARRIRVLPSSDCWSIGSIRCLHASLCRAASFDFRRITSHPGHPAVRPWVRKSDRRSCVWRGARTAGSSRNAGGSNGTGSTSTGALIPIRASPGRRLLGCNSEAVCARMSRFHRSDGGRRRTERHFTKPVAVRISDSALPWAKPT